MGKTKASLSLLLVAVSLHMVSAEAVEVASLSIGDDFNLAADPNRSSLIIPVSNLNRGYLEEAEIAIGTVLKSYHFAKYDYHAYNETHNGVYININK